MNLQNIIISNAVADLDPKLHSIYGCLGYKHTLLFPLNVDGTPDVPFPDKISILDTHASHYLSRLRRSSIGVMCGPRSRGLACIVCASNDVLGLFLADNPFLTGTLRTISASGSIQLFVRVAGDYPPSVELGTLQWRSAGIVPLHSPHAKSGYDFVNVAEPMVITFDQIKWPADLEFNFRVQKLQQQAPITIKERGIETLNDQFVVPFFLLHHSLSFDPASRTFYRPTESGSEWVCDEVVQQDLIKVLQMFARAAGTRIDVDFSPKHLRDLVALLRIACVAPLKTFEAGLTEFVSTALRRQPSHSVTVAELYPCYVRFCGSRDVSSFTEHQFKHRIEMEITNRFGIAKSNDVVRNGTCRRGFWNLSIIPETSERTERTERTGGETKKDQVEANILRLFCTEADTIATTI